MATMPDPNKNSLMTIKYTLDMVEAFSPTSAIRHNPQGNLDGPTTTYMHPVAKRIVRL